MKKRLFIIGNGFDLFFGLPTKPEYFVEELRKVKFHKFESALEVYEKYGIYDWTNYEEVLATIDLNAIEEEVLDWPDYLSDSESDRDGVILQVESYTNELIAARKQAFKNMIAKAEEKVGEIEENEYADFFTSSDDILSFNYTATVEMLFNYEKDVFHIHGYYSDGDELVFGFGKESDDYYKYISKLDSEVTAKKNKEIAALKSDNSLSQDEKALRIEDIECNYQEYGGNDPYLDKEYEAIARFYQANKKQYQINELKNYLNSLGHIDEVVILGHGLGDVDREYMELIEKTLSPYRWIVSVKDIAEIKEKEAVCGTYSFKNKVIIQPMKDIISVKNTRI